MSRKKSRIVKVAEILTGQDAAETETPAALAGQWWTTITMRQFKDTIAQMTPSQCMILVAVIRQAVRETTLRPHTENMTLEQQKIAPRMAAIHRGCTEALLSRIHGFPADTLPKG